MKNKKSKLPIVCAGIIIVLLIAVIVLLVVLLNKDSNEQNYNNQTNVENTQNIEQVNVAKTDEKIIEEEVLEYLNKANEATEEKFLDCRIDSITIVTGKEKEEILNMDQGQYYKESDILFAVNYSIKPQDPKNSMWNAGKGAPAVDGWFNLYGVGKLRDGKIGSQGLGTGW